MIFLPRFILWSRRSKIAAPMIIFTAVVIAVIGNTCGFMLFDDQSLGDSLWYSVISITTIGYGDLSASSAGARICTVIFIVLLGLLTFSMALGWAVDTYQTISERGKRGMGRIFAAGHIIIVNFPGEARVRQVLRELSVDAHYKDKEVVIVSDQINELPPLGNDHVQFVHGSPLDHSSFERAEIQQASAAIILASDYSKPAESDAYVSSIVLSIENMNRDVHTVAECLDPTHAPIFKASHCDSIVYGLQMATNLLVQEMQDPGVSEVFRVLTSNTEGYTLYSTKILQAAGLKYNDLAHALLDAGANMISVTRDGQHHTLFGDLCSQGDDIVVYTAEKRYSWQELVNMANPA